MDGAAHPPISVLIKAHFALPGLLVENHFIIDLIGCQEAFGGPDEEGQRDRPGPEIPICGQVFYQFQFVTSNPSESCRKYGVLA